MVASDGSAQRAPSKNELARSSHLSTGVCAVAPHCDQNKSNPNKDDRGTDHILWQRIKQQLYEYLPCVQA